MPTITVHVTRYPTGAEPDYDRTDTEQRTYDTVEELADFLNTYPSNNGWEPSAYPITDTDLPRLWLSTSDTFYIASGPLPEEVTEDTSVHFDDISPADLRTTLDLLNYLAT